MYVKKKSTSYFQEIYLEHAPALLGFARKFVSTHIAEDTVHDVFLKFWEKKLLQLEVSDLKPLLYTAVRNACIDYLRHVALSKKVEDKRVVLLKLDELDFYKAPDDIYIHKSTIEMIMIKINELPERNREIFCLSYFSGFKANEIADKLNISVRTVENQLYKALLYLRKHCLRL